MDEVHFTLEEVGDILELRPRTVLRYAQGAAGEEKHFARAYLLHNSRRMGYRIPAIDLYEYAERAGGVEGERLKLRVDRALRRKQAEEANSPVAV